MSNDALIQIHCCYHYSLCDRYSDSTGPDWIGPGLYTNAVADYHDIEQIKN